MRKFQKVSLRQYISDGGKEYDLDRLQLPKRGTKNSAGYDIFTPVDITIAPHSHIKVPTGIRVFMEEDDYLAVHIRSSIGSKNHVRLSNVTGIVDSDYSDAKNEGHMWMFLTNDSDVQYHADAGERICQCIFNKYFITDDDNVDGARIGGMGSTGK